MNYGTCHRKIATNTPEGLRLLKYNEDWKKTLFKLKEKKVFGVPHYDKLMLGNFSAAIINWGKPSKTIVPGHRKSSMGIKSSNSYDTSRIVLGNNILKRGSIYLNSTFEPGKIISGIPHNQNNEKVVFSCSRISNENKKTPFKHELGKDFYDNLIVNEDKNYEFNNINVNEYRSIGLGHERHNDSEAKILEYINLFVKEKEIEEFTVHLFSQLEPCLSCDYIIIKFLERFPKSNMYLYYQYAYNKLTINGE